MFIMILILFKFNYLFCLAFINIFDTFLGLALIPQLNAGHSGIESN